MTPRPLLPALSALFALCAHPCDAQESSAASGGGDRTLHNGIALPETWPPRDREVLSVEPKPVPYLATPPAVIPIDVGRQLFVGDFLIEETDLVRTFQPAEKYRGNPVLVATTCWRARMCSICKRAKGDCS